MPHYRALSGRNLFVHLGPIVLLAFACSNSAVAQQAVVLARGGPYAVDTGDWQVSVERKPTGSQCTAGAARTCYTMYLHIQNASNQDLTCSTSLTYDDNSVTRSATKPEQNVVLARTARFMSVTQEAAALLRYSAYCTAPAVNDPTLIPPPPAAEPDTQVPPGTVSLSITSQSFTVSLDESPDYVFHLGLDVSNGTNAPMDRLIAIVFYSTTLGGDSGYEVGRARLGTIPARTRSSFAGDIGQRMFPPPGDYFESVLIAYEDTPRQYIARAALGPTPTRSPQFGTPGVSNWGSGVPSGQVGITGPSSWRSQFGQVTLNVGAVRNRRNTNTGELYLNLVAFDSPEATTGRSVARVAIGAIPAGGYRLQINETVPLIAPPAGTYHMRALVTEDAGTTAIARLEFGGTATFTAPPPVVTQPDPVPPPVDVEDDGGGGGATGLFPLILLAGALIARRRCGSTPGAMASALDSRHCSKIPLSVSSRTMTSPRRVRALRGAWILSALALCGCSSGGGDGGGPPEVPAAAPPPPLPVAVQLSSGQLIIDAASTVTLTWNSQGASSCQAVGDWSGEKTIIGTEVLGPLLRSVNVGLVCTGAGGSASQNIAIEVQPLLEIELRQGVTELDPAFAALLVEIDEDGALFNGPVQLDVGSVFIHEGGAYKVSGSSVANGQTTVELEQPELAEMFERLRLAGSLEDEDEVGTAAVGAKTLGVYSVRAAAANEVVKLKCPRVSRDFPLISLGGISVAGQFHSRCSAVFDYEFTGVDGVKKVRFDVVLDASVGQGKLVLPAVNLNATRPLLPRPVSAAIPQVPGLLVSFMPGIKGQFELGFFMESNWTAVLNLDAGFNYSGSGTTSYANVRKAGVTLVPQAVGVMDTATGGLSGSALLAAHGDVSIDMLKWPLFGIRAYVGPGGNFTVSGPANDLCLKYDIAAKIGIGGYVNSFGDEFEKVKEFSEGGGPGQFGNCTPPGPPPGPPTEPFSGTGTFAGSGTLDYRTEIKGEVFECSVDTTSSGNWSLNLNAAGVGAMQLTNVLVIINGCGFTDFKAPLPAMAVSASRDGDVIQATETLIAATVTFNGFLRDGKLEGDLAIEYDPEGSNLTGVIEGPIAMQNGA